MKGYSFLCPSHIKSTSKKVKSLCLNKQKPHRYCVTNYIWITIYNILLAYEFCIDLNFTRKQSVTASPEHWNNRKTETSLTVVVFFKVWPPGTFLNNAAGFLESAWSSASLFPTRELRELFPTCNWENRLQRGAEHWGSLQSQETASDTGKMRLWSFSVAAFPLWDIGGLLFGWAIALPRSVGEKSRVSVVQFAPSSEILSLVGEKVVANCGEAAKLSSCSRIPGEVSANSTSNQVTASARWEPSKKGAVIFTSWASGNTDFFLMDGHKLCFTKANVLFSVVANRYSRFGQQLDIHVQSWSKSYRQKKKKSKRCCGTFRNKAGRDADFPFAVTFPAPG